jgi:hypothetical protein
MTKRATRATGAIKSRFAKVNGVKLIICPPAKAGW